MDGVFAPSLPLAHSSAYPQAFAANGMFGWLHVNPQSAAKDVAVLICGPLSREALDSHHSLRVMADAFADAGFATMRFDYTGTGNSCDLAATADEPIEPWTIWQRNIHAAANHLRQATGASRLILCGLRIGATLAALVSESRDDIAGLILLAPVLRGRPFLRQLQIEAELAHGKPATRNGGLEFQELSLPPATVDLIGEVDLRRAQLKTGLKIAIFSQMPSKPLTECVAAWAAQGVVLSSHSFDGLEPLLCADTQGYSEPAAADNLIDWINKEIPSLPAFSGTVPGAGQPRLHLPGCTETPLRFGPQQRLFGILSRPEQPSGETAVIIVNTGRNPQTGLGRFGVEFARRLAACGITALRFDFAGLGDSFGPAAEENIRSDVFETERTADISAAIDALEQLGEQLGCRRFVVQGICSGAYHALHAAVTETRIDAVMMANLPLFRWTEGDSIAESKKRSYSLSHYGAKLAAPAYWARLFRGETDVLGIIKGQLSRLIKRARRPAQNGNADQNQDPATFARSLMTKLSRRHAKTLFLYDPDHAGAYEIQSMFGKGGEGLKSFPGAEIQMIPLGDAVGERAAGKIAADVMIEFIK